MNRLKEDTAAIRNAVKQMEMSFEQFRQGPADRWPALDELKSVLARYETFVDRGSDAPHNVMRVDVCMAYVYPMVEDGLELNALVSRVQEAIIATVDRETEWRHDCVVVKSSGGNGNNGKPLCDVEITYDFS